MKYIKTQDFRILAENYDHLIAYGTGWTIKWDNLWPSLGYEAIIDGKERHIGEKWNGIEVFGKSYLSKVAGKILVVIYSGFEAEIIEEIKALGNKNIDTIFYKLLGNVPSFDRRTCFPEVYAKNGEDILIVNQLAKFRIEVPQYLEIGVFHPINRNNTYLLNRLYSGNPHYRGVLVEANPLCWQLIEEYREEDELIRGGVSSREGKLEFTVFPTRPGLSTFNSEISQKWINKKIAYKKYMIKTSSINHIIKEHFDRVPDVLSLDAEGLDYEILSDLDFVSYPIRIIVLEAMDMYKKQLESMMKIRGYQLAASTWENQIWVYGGLWENGNQQNCKGRRGDHSKG